MVTMSSIAAHHRTPLSGPLQTATRAIQRYLDDPRVIEIMCNDDGRIWLDRAGEKMSMTDTVLTPADAELFLRFVATESQTTLTRAKPSCSGTLPYWGARVQGLVPPAVPAPTFSIRKPALLLFSLDDYVSKGVLTEAQKDALTRAVLERRNILVGGGTGTGKTTFANALLRVITECTADRLYIIEDTAELQCTAPNKVMVRTKPGEYDATAALFDALRMRPDRIIVGELRDGTAHVLLKGWNTGHPGGIATIHADDTAGMLNRVCDLVEERVQTASRRSVAEAIQICVHLTLDKSAPAGRRLSGIDRVVGYERTTERWVLEPLL